MVGEWDRCQKVCFVRMLCVKAVRRPLLVGSGQCTLSREAVVVVVVGGLLGGFGSAFNRPQMTIHTHAECIRLCCAACFGQYFTEPVFYPGRSGMGF